MKRRHSFFTFAICLILSGPLLRLASAEGAGTHLTVMTYNVLCSFCDPKHFDRWEERIASEADIIKRYKPDLIGFQEISKPEEVDQIAALNKEYSSIYYRDPDGLKTYPDATIFYRTDRFDVLEQGTIWLSETPDTPWSKGWAKLQFWRIVIWAHLKQKSNGREFYFATTHFDNNFPNQEKSAPIVLDRISQWAQKLPVVFVGDFNSRPNSKAYGILSGGVDGKGFKLTNAYDIAAAKSSESNQNPKPAYDESDRIDHIWFAGPGPFHVPKWMADMYVFGVNKRYPSDHFPIIAEVEF